MNKLSNTAKKLDIFFKILLGLLGVGTVIFIGAVIAVFASQELGNFVLNLNGIAIDIQDGMLSSVNYRNVVLLGVAMYFVSIFLIVYGIIIIRKILKPMQQGMPFSPSVSHELKKMGWLTIIGGIVYTIFDVFGKFFLIRLVDNPELTDVAFRVEYRIDPTFLIIAAILFLFSYIFHYGSALQQQVDETL